MNIPDNLKNKIKREGDCWLWTAAISKGSPVFRSEGKTRHAGRYLYSQRKDIPKRHVLVQTCRNRHCVNPDHQIDLPPKDAYQWRCKVVKENRDLARALITKPWREVFA